MILRESRVVSKYNIQYLIPLCFDRVQSSNEPLMNPSSLFTAPQVLNPLPEGTPLTLVP